jgi:hypothetical protein
MAAHAFLRTARIIDVSAALGDPKYLTPFFRIPGLARSDVVESELATRVASGFYGRFWMRY